jgi:DtxR family Mn-dependent transcriptional regulator
MTKIDENSNFRTPNGYDKTENSIFTPAMEDYLEMIRRMEDSENTIHVNHLAKKLHVKPSSASKMVSHLKEKELVSSEKYGLIQLTKEGRKIGDYLLHRHAVIHRFLCWVNHSEDELLQTERIEHFIDERTVQNMEQFLSDWNNSN